MIRIGSVEDAVLESGAEWSAEWSSEWSSEALSSWTRPLVPRQRGSVESGTTTS